MSPAWIRPRSVSVSRRNPKGGTTYQVLYRRGGRGYPIETAGTFKTKKDATIRRDLVSGWLAAGLDPKAQLAEPPAAMRVLTVRAWAPRYRDSRIDYAAATAEGLDSHLARVLASSIADLAVDQVRLADVQDVIVEWVAAELKPSTITRYLTTLKQLLDFAGVDPNPARSPQLRIPKIVREEALVPTGDHLVKMLDKLSRRFRLPLITAEQTAMRIGEVCSLQRGDVDEDGSRFRLRAAATKTSRGRWVQVPGWLMIHVAATVPREDRTETRRVFPNLTEDAARNAMARACRTAGIPIYSPHDLRHRRTSLWHNQGVPFKELSERIGHVRASMTLDVYSHFMPVDEVPEATLQALLVMTP